MFVIISVIFCLDIPVANFHETNKRRLFSYTYSAYISLFQYVSAFLQLTLLYHNSFI